MFEFLTYSILKDAIKLGANVLKDKKNITVFRQDSWRVVRNDLLQILRYSDTYLSVAYIKGKDNNSQYWADDAGKLSIEFDKSKCNCLIRRVVIYGDCVGRDTQLCTDGKIGKTINAWLTEQFNAGIDIFEVNASTLNSNINKNDLLSCLNNKKKLIKITQKESSEVTDSEMEHILNQDDFQIMDIGIYGLTAVGCQFTDETGKSTAFVLSKRECDIAKAMQYFHKVCTASNRFSPE